MKEYIEKAMAFATLVDFPGELSPENIGLAVARKAIDALPAADVVEVRHGYWIDHHSGGSFCSACKRWVPYSHHPKYCETCGARMDGKENDHAVN